MKSLLAAASILCAQSQDDVTCGEEASLMQGFSRRVDGELTAHDDVGQGDATARLLETATKMMKNGATPDVITFIESTITEVNSEVLGRITDEHYRDQQLVNDMHGRFQTTIDTLLAAHETSEQMFEDRDEASVLHKECRSGEALDCARSRRCERQLEEDWSQVKMQEELLRDIHNRIHDEWCVHPPTINPDPYYFEWSWSCSQSDGPEGAWAGCPLPQMPETSQTTGAYPVLDFAQDVRDFRQTSVTDFGLYIIHEEAVRIAWQTYNARIIECAQLEETLDLKVTQCDTAQTLVNQKSCDHVEHNIHERSLFGREWQTDLETYNALEVRVRQLEADRKREWETLHIVTCLLEHVYTRVEHAIETGEPCPTDSSHPEETETDINFCHVIEESMTANLTLIIPDPPTPPVFPPLLSLTCSAEFIWEEQGHFTAAIQTEYARLLGEGELGTYFTSLSAHGWAGCAAPKVCVPCSGIAVDPPNPAYETLSVPCQEHQESLRPGEMSVDTFRCLSSECVPAFARCNGVDNCGDASDEQGCDTFWSTPAVLQESSTEECREGATVVPSSMDDVQFFCNNGQCTSIEGRCNGFNNCADASDEQNCPSDVAGLTVEPTSGLDVTVERATVESAVFHDRQYHFDSLGGFAAKKYIKASNEDKHTPHTKVQMKLRLPQPLTVYVVKLANHQLPWLLTGGWSASALEGVTYSGVRQTRHTEWSGDLQEDHYGPGEVFEQTFPAGTVSIPGNGGGDGSYLLFVGPAVSTQAPAELITMAGCTNSAHFIFREVRGATDTGAVRCCSWDGNSCETQNLPGGCQEDKTFYEAETICADASMRLCSESEMESGTCCGSGCGYDATNVWTSTDSVSSSFLD